MLYINDSVSGGRGEQPAKGLVIETEDGRYESQPVEETQVPTHYQYYLGRIM